MLKRWSLPLALLTVLALPVLALASEGHPSIPGAELSAVWVIPFVCMLLSIAVMPLALPHIWHHHFGKDLHLLGACLPDPLSGGLRFQRGLL